MKYTKSKIKIGDRLRILKNDNPFRKGYKPIFEILATSTKKPPAYIIKDLEKKRSGKIL